MSLSFIILYSLPSDYETQKNRLMIRNGYTESEAEQRIKAQIDLSKKCELSNFVIDSSASFEETRTQVVKVLNYIQSSKHHLMVRLQLFIGAVILFFVIGFILVTVTRSLMWFSHCIYILHVLKTLVEKNLYNSVFYITGWSKKNLFTFNFKISIIYRSKRSLKGCRSHKTLSHDGIWYQGPSISPTQRKGCIGTQLKGCAT